MSETVSVAIEMSREQMEELQRLADRLGCPKSALLAQALEDYLALQRWQIGEIERGMQELEEGRGLSHEEVEAWLATWGDDEDADRSR